MGRVDVALMKYLDKDHYRILFAIERGMRKHEVVPFRVVALFANLHRGGVLRLLHELQKFSLAAHEKGNGYDGYRLTSFGYDLLAVRELFVREVITAVGSQIGVGKESDIYSCQHSDETDLVLKFYRLGRTSFRRVTDKRDYYKSHKGCSWLYRSHLASMKEYAFLQGLYENGFPVPKPFGASRHAVLMEFIPGITLCDIKAVKNPGDLYDKLMSIIVRLAEYGVIHGDFNEFNIIMKEDGDPVVFDVPQMVSIEHPNAKTYFERDVSCIVTFFARRFDFHGCLYPKFEDIKRRHFLDTTLMLSGFAKQKEMDRKIAEAVSSESDEGEASEEEEEEDEEIGDKGVDDKEDRLGDQGEGSCDGELSDNGWLPSYMDNTTLKIENLLISNRSECEGEQEHSATTTIDPQQCHKDESGVRVRVNEEIGVHERKDSFDSANRRINSLSSDSSPKCASINADIRKRVGQELHSQQRNVREHRKKGKATITTRGGKARANVHKHSAVWDS